MKSDDVQMMPNSVPAATSPEEAAFRAVAAQLYGYDDCIARCRCYPFDRGLREIVITEIKAQYDEVSHLVLSINGSPPRGTFLIERGVEEVVYMTRSKLRRLRPWSSQRTQSQVGAIMRYIKSLGNTGGG